MADTTPRPAEYERWPTRLDHLTGVPGHTRVTSVRGYDLCCQECSTANRDYVAWPCTGVIRHLGDVVLDNLRAGLLAELHDPWDFRCTQRDPDRPSKASAHCRTCRPVAPSQTDRQAEPPLSTPTAPSVPSANPEKGAV